MDHKPTRAVEDYLQAMHCMARDGSTIIAARLAERLGVAPPTVSVTLKRMVEQHLVTLDDHKLIHLTETGREQAESIVRRHALAERLLTDILGLGWSESHEEAHLVEHVISPKVERRLMQVLGHPKTCPHGNPIPGTGARPSPVAMALADTSVGQRVVVERIVEEAEDDLDLMSYLERSGIIPGAELHVAEISQSTGVVTVERDGARASLGIGAAGMIRVVRREDASVLQLGPSGGVSAEAAELAAHLRTLIAD